MTGHGVFNMIRQQAMPAQIIHRLLGQVVATQNLPVFSNRFIMVHVNSSATLKIQIYLQVIVHIETTLFSTTLTVAVVVPVFILAIRQQQAYIRTPLISLIRLL